MKQVMQLLLHFKAANKYKLVWVGDSHSAFIRKRLRQKVSSDPVIESMVYWLGPRLLYSISKTGIPTTRFFRTLMRIWKPRNVIVVLGEIDIRMFLSDLSLRDSLWVRNYLLKVEDFRKATNLNTIYILTCLPVSVPLNASSKDWKGSLIERLNGSDWLQSEVQKQINLEETFSRIKYLRLNGILLNNEGCLSRNFTEDGIHVNAIGAWALWGEISKQLLKS